MLKLCQRNLAGHLKNSIESSGMCLRHYLACEQALGGMEGKRKGGLYTHLKFYCSALFDIKYLAHNLGSATEMIINITLVDDFMTFNILTLFRPGFFYRLKV